MTQSAKVGSSDAALTKVIAGTEGGYTANAATTLTIGVGALIDGVFNQTGGTTCALTIPTAAAIVAAIPGCQVGSSFTFCVLNGGSGNLTLQAATGVTYSGTGAGVVATTVATQFKGVVTNATASSEAVTLFQCK